MKAMQLTAPRTALKLVDLPTPRPGRGQLLIRVRACGVCRTDLHVVDGELVLTHYCAMANQPRMRLDRRASTTDRLVFAFDGGTNFDPAKDTHVHSGVVEWRGESLHNAWAVYSGGKQTGQNEFVLSRRK